MYMQVEYTLESFKILKFFLEVLPVQSMKMNWTL